MSDLKAFDPLGNKCSEQVIWKTIFWDELLNYCIKIQIHL